MKELEEIEKYKHLENSIGNVFDEVFLEIIHNQPEETTKETSEDTSENTKKYEKASDDLDEFIKDYTCEIKKIEKFEFIIDQQQDFYIMYKINLSSGKKLFSFHQDVESAMRSLSDSHNIHNIHDIEIYLFFIISYYFKTCMPKLKKFSSDDHDHSEQKEEIKQIFKQYESENKVIINILEFVKKIYSKLYKIFFEKFEKSNTGDHNIYKISKTIELYGTLKLLTYNIIFILCSLKIDNVNDTIEYIKNKFEEAEDKYETKYNNNYELYFNKQFNTIINKYKKYNIISSNR